MTLLPEIVVIPTFNRPELLFHCVSHLRGAGYTGPIAIFPDGKHFSYSYDISAIFDATVVPRDAPRNPNYYGNSSNAARALSYGYNMAELVHYIEDDVEVSDRWHPWTMKTHEESDLYFPIFCSAGWVCNRERPIRHETYFNPWLYIPQFSIKRKPLGEILKHCTSEYFSDMPGYCRKTFPETPLNKMGAMRNHYEIDGLIQHIIMEDQSIPVAWNAWPTVKHLGFAGYNRGGYALYELFFEGCKSLGERTDRIRDFSLDGSWRMYYFGREVVEREEGGRIKPIRYTYLVDVDGWRSFFTTEIPPRGHLPSVLNSVPIPPGAEITLVGKSV